MNRILFAIVAILLASITHLSCAGVTVTGWGALETGETVQLIQIERPGIRASIATYGAQLVTLEVPDRDGEFGNVILAHKSLEEAEKGGVLGSVIGRFANRIADGGFTIDGRRFDLESVNGKTGVQIHGGKTGFQRRNWEIEPDPVAAGFAPADESITLKYLSADGEEGFPGNLTAWVQYRLEENSLVLQYRARTDRPTHVNLTNHAYFNLAGNGDILGHELLLRSDQYLDADERKVPTGKILGVNRTRFDFRYRRNVSRDLPPEKYPGLDHCFVVPDNGRVGELLDLKSGRRMRIETTQPGVQVYTANHFRGNPFPRFGAICFETQRYPNSPNITSFPSSLLRPGETYDETTRFTFDVVERTTDSEIPVTANPETRVNQFAGRDLIKHPTGIAFTRGGKLLVIESHTHFPPKDYTGPESDRIVWLEDRDGDGTADHRSIFFEGPLVATMDIATHPETGAIYVATRNEVLRLWDRDDDGIADRDSIERKLVFLDTEGNYPHNGCSGLCFDDNGDLIFGIGENLGVAYTLLGSDGTSHSDHGEGGNIWHVTRDGGHLRRIATGFWNPFGVCHAPGGHLFATDNDPSSRPPSRLHYVIEGGDYGYQFRYGRSGQHPFISWNGELPGTLPMLHGTGEAPCDVLYHQGNLLVGSWSDHRVELYPLDWKGTHFATEPSTLLSGGIDFRPVAFAVAPDGVLYISDWVKRDYQLHGYGAIWRVENWKPEAKPIKVSLNEKAEAEDPWNLSRMISGNLPVSHLSGSQKAYFELLHARYHSTPEGEQLIREALAPKQSDETLRLLALKWVADRQLESFGDLIDKEIEEPSSATLFHAAVTARSRIQGKKVMDADIQSELKKELSSSSPTARQAAFLLLSDRERIELLTLRELYSNGDEALRAGIALTLLGHRDGEGARRMADEIVASDDSEIVRAFASLSDSDPAEIRPSQPADIGRFMFHKSCAQCHRALGFGKNGGPDLSYIGIRGREHIRQSILDPSAEIAPQYEAWKVSMSDGEEPVGFLLGEKGGNHYYSDASGREFTIDSREMVSREQLPISMMPPGLNLTMTPEDFEHLLNWLSGLK